MSPSAITASSKSGPRTSSIGHNLTSVVKARQQARLRELTRDIPFSLRPYMLDTDKLGGREFLNDDEEVELQP